MTEEKGAPILGPAAVYTHDHPPVRNVNEEFENRLSFGQRLSDRLTALVGSWPFILVQSSFLVVWMTVNAYLLAMDRLHHGFLKAWDPYPFILLNLILSFQAAYTGPIVMMSQNRMSDKDRLAAQQDFEVNQKAEKEIEVILRHLAHQDQLILKALQRLESLNSALVERGK